MRLRELIFPGVQLWRGSGDLEISTVEVDSRKVQPGSLFCALPGALAEGTDFIPQALRAGAVAVLVPKASDEALLRGDYPVLKAENPREAAALAAAALYGFPGEKLSLLGVTGTNGKTTVSYLLDSILRAAGQRTGLVGTVEIRFGDQRQQSTHTTPESVELQRLLARMVEASVKFVAIEVSSHSLAQSRLAGLEFKAAAFTQLGRDHLDFHGDLESYFQSKALLFRQHLAKDAVSIINIGDPWGRRLADELRAKGREVWGFLVEPAGAGQVRAEESVEGREGRGLGKTQEGSQEGSQKKSDPLRPALRASEVHLSLAGFEATFETPVGHLKIRSPLVGAHNVENALSAAGLALAAGIPAGAVVEGLAGTGGAPGRLEGVVDADGRRIFVDYAHTPDALARVLEALRSLTPEDKRIVTVFGCGGDRDKGKRAPMGLAAAANSEVVIVTSDNPRSEDPRSIIDAILPGVIKGGLQEAALESLCQGSHGFLHAIEREDAIAKALRIARAGEVVLIAGKGHEGTQQIGKEIRDFDDREVSRRLLEELRSPEISASSGAVGGAESSESSESLKTLESREPPQAPVPSENPNLEDGNE